MARARADATVDVVVVGGGSAGVAAALAAARCGARTLLLEASDHLGGNASLAQVHTICGLYHPADEGPARPVHTGLAGGLESALRAAGGAGRPERAGRVHYLPIEPEIYARFLAEQCASEPGLEVARGREVRAAARVGDGFRVETADASVEASLAIDASGAARLAAQLGTGRDVEAAQQLGRGREEGRHGHAQ